MSYSVEKHKYRQKCRTWAACQENRNDYYYEDVEGYRLLSDGVQIATGDEEELSSLKTILEKSLDQLKSDNAEDVLNCKKFYKELLSAKLKELRYAHKQKILRHKLAQNQKDISNLKRLGL